MPLSVCYLTKVAQKLKFEVANQPTVIDNLSIMKVRNFSNKKPLISPEIKALLNKVELDQKRKLWMETTSSERKWRISCSIATSVRFGRAQRQFQAINQAPGCRRPRMGQQLNRCDHSPTKLFSVLERK